MTSGGLSRLRSTPGRGSNRGRKRGVGARTDAGTQGEVPVGHALIASTLCSLLFFWNSSCFRSFLFSPLPLNYYPAAHPALCQPFDVCSVTNEAEVSVLYIYEKLESPSSVSKFEKGLRRRPLDWVRTEPDRRPDLAP